MGLRKWLLDLIKQALREEMPELMQIRVQLQSPQAIAPTVMPKTEPAYSLVSFEDYQAAAIEEALRETDGRHDA